MKFFAILGLFLSSNLVAQTFGDYAYREIKDPITDATQYLVTTESVPGSPDSRGGLAWMCEGAELKILYSFGTSLISSTDVAQVIYRVDDKPASQGSNWTLRSQKRAGYMPSENVRDLTTAAIAGKRVTLRATGYSSGDVKTHVFSLNGVSTALAKLPCYKP